MKSVLLERIREAIGKSAGSWVFGLKWLMLFCREFETSPIY